VEEWFHVFDHHLPDSSTWDALPARAPAQVERLMDLLEARSARATFFVLGWFARRHPRTVEQIHARGHEVACHSDLHSLLYRMSPDAVREELVRARDSLEQATGAPVLGFRAPAFSIRPDTRWAFDAILETGFAYDSSLFPAPRLHGGIPGAPRMPHFLLTPGGMALPEVPVSTFRFAGMDVPFGGGGYFRLAPGAVTRWLARRTLARGHPFVTYHHPRDLDLDSPRLRGGLATSLRWYVGVRGASRKLERLLDEFPPVRYVDYLRNNGFLGFAPRSAGLEEPP